MVLVVFLGVLGFEMTVISSEERFKQPLFCNKRHVCFHVPGPPNLTLFLQVLQLPQSTRRQTLQFPQLAICGLEMEELCVFVTDLT